MAGFDGSAGTTVTSFFMFTGGWDCWGVLFLPVLFDFRGACMVCAGDIQVR